MDHTVGEMDADWLVPWIQLSKQLRRQLGEQYSSDGLGESRVAVLEALTNLSRDFTQADLASELSISESSLCSLIERMRLEGLILRERSILDRRRTVLSITDAGRERCAAVQRIRQDFAAQLNSHLGREMLKAIIPLVEALSRGLAEMMASQTDVRRAA